MSEVKSELRGSILCVTANKNHITYYNLTKYAVVTETSFEENGQKCKELSFYANPSDLKNDKKADSITIKPT